MVEKLSRNLYNRLAIALTTQESVPYEFYLSIPRLTPPPLFVILHKPLK